MLFLPSEFLLSFFVGGDSYYSDDSSSSKEELSRSAEDLRPASSGLMVEKELRPRSNSARHLTRNRSPNRNAAERKHASKDTSPARSPHGSPSKSPQHAKLAPKRSSEGASHKEIGQIQPELYITEAVQTKYITPTTSSSKSPKNKKDELMEECFGTMAFSVKYDQSR